MSFSVRHSASLADGDELSFTEPVAADRFSAHRGVCQRIRGSCPGSCLQKFTSFHAIGELVGYGGSNQALRYLGIAKGSRSTVSYRERLCD